MNYQVSEKKGEPRQVGLRETDEGQYEVTLEGRTVHIDAVRSGSTIYSIIEDGRQFEAMVDERGDHGFDILVAGRLFHLDALDERTMLLAGSVAPVASGPQTIEAEMPGKIVKVGVAVGDNVTEGQGLLILEAMKMENEIPAPIDGVVTEMLVSEGETVEAGAALLTIEPPAAEATDAG